MQSLPTKTRTFFNNENLNKWGSSNLSPNFIFKELLTHNIDCSYGICNTFDTYISKKDNKLYLAFSNISEIEKTKTININILPLNGKNIFYKTLSPSYHQKELTFLKYFINPLNNQEYLISIDAEKIVVVWSITYNYKFLYKINTYYKDCIYCCLILFKENNNDSILLSCCGGENDETSSSKEYGLIKGNFIRNINGTSKEKIRNMLIWNKNNDQILICLCELKIIFIDLIKNEKKVEINQNNNTYNCGFIYKENFENIKEYLCVSCSNGHIIVYDLENNQITKDFSINDGIHRFYDILVWNEEFFIVSDCYDSGYLILQFKEGGKFIMISNIKCCDSDDIECIRKIKHETYGECLVTGSHSGKMKIFGLNSLTICG